MKKVFSYGSAAAAIIGAAMFSASCNHGSDDSAKFKGETQMSNFDTTVKPQNDFYQYVNGTWLKNNPIPKSEAAWGSFDVLNDSVTSRLRKILEAVAAQKGAADGSLEQKIGDLFYTIMDSNDMNKAGVSALSDEFKNISSISDIKGLWTESAHLMKIGPDVMFGFGVEQDSKISSKEICEIGQGGMTLPSKEYYLSDNPRMQKIRDKYIEYATQLFQQLSESPEQADKDAHKVMDIETKMATAAMSRVELRNIAAQYNKMTYAELEKMTPDIDWNTCLSTWGMSNVDSVIVAQVDFMKEVNTMTKSISLDDWKTYLRFHLVSSEATKLGDTIAKINFNFWGRTLQGLQEMQPRWKRAVQATSRSVGQLLGQLYVKQYFSPEAKEKVHHMVENIIAAYKDRINQVTWMSPETKKYAMQKLDKIMLKLCYPDKWKDYSALHIKRDAWVLNSFRINEFEFNYDAAKLGKPVDRTEWGMSPQTVNAYYNPSMNEIVFPAAIMQPPFFDMNRDDAMNYGAMGAVIGHELTHGFDDQGAQFDANGDMHKWWTDADSAHYYGKLQVLIRQFNNYEIDSMHVNGSLTIGENTADLGGLTIAYYALQTDLKQHPEGVVDGFTPEQRFFIAWAQAWRENIRPDYQRQLINTNPHSPTVFRANGPLSNMTEFYKAFSVKSNESNPELRSFEIKPGDGMYRPDTARAVIW